MYTMKKQLFILLLSVCSVLFVLSGCGSSSEEPEGDLTLQNDLGEEVTLTNKERATVLFHFTEVG
ncbi:hypothetical protein [Halalkalibacter urbisdiaboli]|uniref:hypothetical protein n=1 Tax=Halalkalibacter urbisdiaboli TaxID=1960589 RepID=UPI000B451153|nr:hypothetical protein [Halalkalibacter urbisdiaboli]